MEYHEDKTIEELLHAYSTGQRHFTNRDFEEEGSVEGIDLREIIFENCFLFLNFRNANLSKSKFISCNIKTADFRGANLDNAMIKNCSVESTMFKGASIKDFQFTENYYFGLTIGQDHFEKSLKDSDEEKIL